VSQSVRCLLRGAMGGLNSMSRRAVDPAPLLSRLPEEPRKRHPLRNDRLTPRPIERHSPMEQDMRRMLTVKDVECGLHC